MKKLLVFLLATILMLTLTACGEQGDAPAGDANDPGTSQGDGSTASGTAIKDINADNWAEVVSENFGLDLTLPEGWSVKEVSSPNGASNVKLYFNVGGEATYNTFGETLFAELKKDAVGDITKYMSESTVYATFADAAATPGIATFSAKVSEDGDKTVVINYYDNGTNVEITLQRTGTWA